MNKKISIISSILLLAAILTISALEPIKVDAPQRAAGQQSVLELRTEPLNIVRVAFIGVGNRGMSAVKRWTYLENVEIVAICDVVPDKVKKAQNIVSLSGRPTPKGYSGVEDWKKVCERDDVDIVYICTHWALHTPIAVYAMENGKHAATEVPASTTIEDCWKLVDTAERTQRHCMMLENCNYDFFEMATLNMAQQGFFGEIVHVEGAYIHDLRDLNFSDTVYWEKWRIKENEVKNGNLYPTHGLGPLAHILNIHRGDKMNYLVSVSSDQYGMTEYAKDKYGEDSIEAKTQYARGDMNTTLIKTAKGKTMMIQHDVTSPRPYSRIHLISGTKAFAQKWPIEGISEGHSFYSKAKHKATMKKYEHPIIKEIGKKAKKVGGHGGMDFTMDYRLVYCLQNGLPLDQDVYDAAEWSAIVELTQISVANNGAPVIIPDFTRGDWSKVDGITYYR